MPIEFRCTGCNKLLRTKDDSAGKQARCPECGTLLTVPEKAAPIVPAPQPSPQLAPAEQAAPKPNDIRQQRPAAGNPYSAPLDDAAMTSADESRPGQLDLGDALTRAWRIFKANLGPCILASMVVVIVSLVAQGLFNGLYFALLRSGDRKIAEAFSGITGLIGLGLGIYLQTGQQYFMLKVARGEPAEIGDVFRGGRWFGSVLAASLLFGIIFMCGICLVVGWLFALLILWPYPYVIIERNAGPIQALKLSAEATQGNRLALFLIGLVVMLIAVPLLFFTLGLGFILYGPYVSLLMAVVYLIMTGQRTADRLTE